MQAPTSPRELAASLKAAGMLEYVGPIRRESVNPVVTGRHTIFERHALWDYLPDAFAAPFAPSDPTQFDYKTPPGQKPLFATLKADDSLPSVLEQTSWLVFFGACLSPALVRALADPHSIKLILDADIDRLLDLAAHIGQRALEQNKVFLFGGPMHKARPSLSSRLPDELAKAGFPAIFVQDGLIQSEEAYVTACTEHLEVFYFRKRLYNLEPQGRATGYPLRPITRNLNYDQQCNILGNVPLYLSQPSIAPLANRAPGCTAILVGAGPDLDERMPFILENAQRCVIISVGKALPSLRRHGIEPDFTITNDTCLASYDSLAAIEGEPRSPLVSHCLAGVPAGRFSRIYFFGNWQSDLYGERPDLLLHGSVITTAFSLAKYLGCRQAVLIGAQLCSTSPFCFEYAAGITGDAACARIDDSQRRFAFPELAQTTNALGRTLYTTPNFLDTALWMQDHMAQSGLRVINTAEISLLHGPGIRFDPWPDLRECSKPKDIEPANPPLPKGLAPLRAKAWLINESNFWRSVAESSNALADRVRQGLPFEPAASELIALYDKLGVSYLLERAPGFRHTFFYTAYFRDGLAAGRKDSHEQGASNYFESAAAMGQHFAALAEQSLARLPSDS